MLVLNVVAEKDDEKNLSGTGRLCLFEESADRAIALRIDSSRAACVFADFAKRARGQLPSSYEKKKPKAANHKFIRLTLLPCRSNAAVTWANFMTDAPWAKCETCSTWRELGHKLASTATSWTCDSCRAAS